MVPYLFKSPEEDVDEEAVDCWESGLGGSVAEEAFLLRWSSSNLISPKSMTRRSCGESYTKLLICSGGTTAAAAALQWFWFGSVGRGTTFGTIGIWKEFRIL